MGIISGQPVATGAGVLAQSRQQVFLRWNSLTKVKFKPRQHTILLRAGLTDNIGLFCSPDNYPLVEQFVKEKTKHLASS